MKKALGDDALNEIFREARTHGAWLDKPVSDEVLRQLYDLMKWGRPVPTVVRADLSFCALRKRKSACVRRWLRETSRRRLPRRSRRSSLTICCFLKSCRSYSLTRPACVICLRRIRSSSRRQLSVTLHSRAPTSSSRPAHLGSIVAQCQVSITRR